MIVLNVGGGSRNLPSNYDGWDQHLLDIDPATNPDICCDGKELVNKQKIRAYDAVYCSHNLEHYYWHDVPTVLMGFYTHLAEGGVVEIHVPNIKNLMQSIGSLDLQDVWYRLGDGTPITYHDVLYGWNKAMAAGNEFYAHKCGFTQISLRDVLEKAGFKRVNVVDAGPNLIALAEK